MRVGSDYKKSYDFYSFELINMNTQHAHKNVIRCAIIIKHIIFIHVHQISSLDILCLMLTCGLY